jgi:hypothetical protein
MRHDVDAGGLVIAGPITNALLMTALANKCDQHREDFVVMSEQAAELEVQLATCLTRIALLEPVLLAAGRVLGDALPSRTGHFVVSLAVLDALAAAVSAAAGGSPTPTPGQSSAGEATP